MKITWFGTASLAVEGSGGRLLIDPFFPFKGSPTTVAADAYEGCDDILVTHGHFDHIMSLPGLAERAGRRIHCTAAPRATLIRLGVPASRIVQIAPGDVFDAAGMTVRVYQSRHVRFDGPLVRRTLLSPRMLRYARNLPRALYGFLAFPEKGETVGFLIECDGRRLFVMGSLNLDDGTDYPTGMDLLALPYQGASDLLTPAARVIARLRPKAVLLDHWDDAFPPISGAVDTSEILNRCRGDVAVFRLDPGGSLEL